MMQERRGRFSMMISSSVVSVHWVQKIVLSLALRLKRTTQLRVEQDGLTLGCTRKLQELYGVRHCFEGLQLQIGWICTVGVHFLHRRVVVVHTRMMIAHWIAAAASTAPTTTFQEENTGIHTVLENAKLSTVVRRIPVAQWATKPIVPVEREKDQWTIVVMNWNVTQSVQAARHQCPETPSSR